MMTRSRRIRHDWRRVRERAGRCSRRATELGVGADAALAAAGSIGGHA